MFLSELKILDHFLELLEKSRHSEALANSTSMSKVDWIVSCCSELPGVKGMLCLHHGDITIIGIYSTSYR